MNKNNTVKRAGGFIIQLLPFASNEVIDKLEEKISKVKSVTELLDRGMTPEMILEHLLGDFDLVINEKIPTAFECNCSKSRVEKAIISIGRKDIQEIIDDNETTEVNCHFCNESYKFSVDDLKVLLEDAKNN